ncbi:unnamed protein product [Peniophora sp. CBMAI 1063]|nr:unnamed protein product [Peniophora sp. CBMAI 1063]
MSLPTQQKALILPSYGPGAAFQLSTRAVPKPGAGQVLIRNTAAALNPLDFAIRNIGIFVTEWPAVVGYDGAGTIVALGPDVQGWKVGDVVVYQGFWPADTGVYQEYTLAPADLVAKIPKNVSVEEASTLSIALATATCALYTAPGPHTLGFTAPWEEGGAGKYKGQAALVIGGSSSVGQLTLQILKLSGFSPIITTASASNEAYCRAAGATHFIDYHTTPYSALKSKVEEILDGKTPLPLVFDAISVDESQKAAWDILKPGGKLVVTLPPLIEGAQPGVETKDGKTLVMAHGSFGAEENLKVSREVFKLLTGWLESGVVKPNRVEVIPGGLNGVVPGLERLETKGVSGVKLVVRHAETA